VTQPFLLVRGAAGGNMPLMLIVLAVPKKLVVAAKALETASFT
jgi:hypothetical protein